MDAQIGREAGINAAGVSCVGCSFAGARDADKYLRELVSRRTTDRDRPRDGAYLSSHATNKSRQRNPSDLGVIRHHAVVRVGVERLSGPKSRYSNLSYSRFSLRAPTVAANHCS
jgi:hypothetical protein